MTEYDYSPAAYERYMAQQMRVSNWVSEQTHRTHEYRNPFVPPSPAPAPARKPSVRTESRPQAPRSKTMPTPDVGTSSANVSRRPSRSSRTREATPPRDVRAPHRSSTRSQTVPPNARYPAPAPAPVPVPAPLYYPQHAPQHQPRYPSPNPPHPPQHHHYHHPRPEPQVYPPHGVPAIPTTVAPYVPPPPAGYNSVYRTYAYDPNAHKEISLPPPRPGETYVIIPPKGRKIEVVVSHLFRQSQTPRV